MPWIYSGGPAGVAGRVGLLGPGVCGLEGADTWSVVIQGLQRKDAPVPDAGYISCTRCDNISQRIVEGGITETGMVLVLSRRLKKLDELTVAVVAIIGYQIPDHSK